MTETHKILVAYATRTGTTEGVAKEVAKILANDAHDVDILPMEDVKNLSSYNAIIAGSAIQNRQWLPEAMQFIQKHRGTISHMNTAMFSVCMTLAMRNGESYRPQVMAWLAPVRGQLKPINEGLFAGVLDIKKIPSFNDRIKFRLSVLFGVWSEGDHRDWNGIRTWADELSKQFYLSQA